MVGEWIMYCPSGYYEKIKPAPSYWLGNPRASIPKVFCNRKMLSQRSEIEVKAAETECVDIDAYNRVTGGDLGDRPRVVAYVTFIPSFEQLRQGQLNVEDTFEDSHADWISLDLRYQLGFPPLESKMLS